MRKGYFFEGFIFGVVSSILGWFIYKQITEVQTQDTTSEEEGEEAATTNSYDPAATEDLVQKTLAAIENGFERISDMVKDKKG